MRVSLLVGSYVIFLSWSVKLYRLISTYFCVVCFCLTWVFFSFFHWIIFYILWYFCIFLLILIYLDVVVADSSSCVAIRICYIELGFARSKSGMSKNLRPKSFSLFFDKNKMIFIHSNREITSFNTAKNVNDESANKLTTSKLIAYNNIMPTKIYDKIKLTGISMASGSATLTPKSLIE